MSRKKGNNVNQQVDQIKRALKKAGIYQRGIIEVPTYNPDSLKQLRNKIEMFLITARNYSDSTILLPRNPFLRLIKKIFLFPLKEIMKTQSVFNKNVLFSLEELYTYIQLLEKKLKNLDKKSS